MIFNEFKQSDTCLVRFRIWDKLCGGSCKILIFVVAVLLNNQRHRLLKCIDLSSVLQVIKNVSENDQ